MKNKLIFGHFGLLTATILVLTLNGCGSGNAAIKAAEEKEAATLATTKGRVSSAQGLRLGYACCNLRYAGDWVSDMGSGELPFIAVGTQMLVREVEGSRANVEADGKTYRFGHDYGRAQEKTPEWVDKLVVLDDPAPKLAKFPASVRTAIEAGKLAKGMTKEQVIMAMGYPATSDTPKLEAPIWKYYWLRYPLEVHWNAGRVSKIEGNPEILAKAVQAGIAPSAEIKSKTQGGKGGKSGKSSK
ncbi:MAG: hypothetical protein RLZZ298_3448 [Pseudomonadota bacterium]|jgi:hypothetical protein